MIVASLLKDTVLLVFKYFSINRWLETLGVVRENELNIWPNLLSELVRWTFVFVFLMSAVDTWGIPKVSEVLGELLSFFAERDYGCYNRLDRFSSSKISF